MTHVISFEAARQRRASVSLQDAARVAANLRRLFAEHPAAFDVEIIPTDSGDHIIAAEIDDGVAQTWFHVARTPQHGWVLIDDRGRCVGHGPEPESLAAWAARRFVKRLGPPIAPLVEAVRRKPGDWFGFARIAATVVAFLIGREAPRLDIPVEPRGLDEEPDRHDRARESDIASAERVTSEADAVGEFPVQTPASRARAPRDESQADEFAIAHGDAHGQVATNPPPPGVAAHPRLVAHEDAYDAEEAFGFDEETPSAESAPENIAIERDAFASLVAARASHQNGEFAQDADPSPDEHGSIVLNGQRGEFVFIDRRVDADAPVIVHVLNGVLDVTDDIGRGTVDRSFEFVISDTGSNDRISIVSQIERPALFGSSDSALFDGARLQLLGEIGAAIFDGVQVSGQVDDSTPPPFVDIWTI